MNHIIQWIAKDKDTLYAWAAQLKKKISSYSYRVEWKEDAVKIREQSLSRHDRVEPYDGYLLEVIIVKGNEMDWRERLAVVNSVQPEYRHYTA
jgi:hypothetical protein